MKFDFKPVEDPKDSNSLCFFDIDFTDNKIGGTFSINNPMFIPGDKWKDFANKFDMGIICTLLLCHRNGEVSLEFQDGKLRICVAHDDGDNGGCFHLLFEETPEKDLSKLLHNIANCVKQHEIEATLPNSEDEC